MSNKALPPETPKRKTSGAAATGMKRADSAKKQRDTAAVERTAAEATPTLAPVSQAEPDTVSLKPPPPELRKAQFRRRGERRWHSVEVYNWRKHKFFWLRKIFEALKNFLIFQKS